MKYYVTVGDSEFEVLVDGDRVTVNGEEHDAHLTVIPETPSILPKPPSIP